MSSVCVRLNQQSVEKDQARITSHHYLFRPPLTDVR